MPFRQFRDSGRLLSIGSFLRSSRLALLLFFILSVFSMYGTFFPTGKAELYLFKSYGERALPAARLFGLVDTYRSPLFLLLLGLLGLNIALCTWHRFRARLRGRRSISLWLDVMLHVSLLVVMAGGALKGGWGFVGTTNVHVGLFTDTVYDWRTESDVSLGFTIAVKERIDEYYPSQVRIGVRDAETGEKISLLEVREGKRTGVPGLEAHLEVDGFDRSAGVFFLLIEAGGKRERFELETDVGGRSTARVGSNEYNLVAWLQDLKSVRSYIVISEEGREVKEGWLVPNGRVAHRGWSLFQTSWGTDPFDNHFVGIQAVRDPGAPVFWTGAVLFSLSLPLFLFIRHRR